MTCTGCGASVPPGRRRFCSKRCSDRFYRTQFVPFICESCGREAWAQRRNASRRRYCSRACYRAHFNRTHLRSSRNGRWRGGRALSYGPGWKEIRAFVRARDGVCRACGRTPEENGRALDVHHLDPHRFSGNNNPENLIALCRSCHMRADDHGRRGSAEFLRAAGTPVRPTKREIRRLRTLVRAGERSARRRENQRRARRMHDEGAGLREIARAIGVSHQTVANWLRGRNTAREPVVAYGARRHAEITQVAA